jgi:preprotein translocase subunit SecD
MKKYSFIVIIITILWQLTACNQDYDKPIAIDEPHFKMTLPGFLKADELAEDAKVEYANRYRNFYVVVFEHNKKNTMDSLIALTDKRIEMQMDSMYKQVSLEKNNGKTVYFSQIDGKYPKEKERIYFFHKIIEGNQMNYEITIWTRGIDRKLKYKDTIQSIFDSFKEK